MSRLDWQNTDSGAHAHFAEDEYIVMHREDRAAPYQWYWCAGSRENLDDCVAGAEETKEAAISFCECVARWRHGWPIPEPKRDLRKEVEQAFAEEGVPVVSCH
jgi:hypothetical protein